LHRAEQLGTVVSDEGNAIGGSRLRLGHEREREHLAVHDLGLCHCLRHHAGPECLRERVGRDRNLREHMTVAAHAQSVKHNGKEHRRTYSSIPLTGNESGWMAAVRVET
jgi:hypothetical protein